MQEEVFFGGPAKVLHVGNATEILGLFRLEKKRLRRDLINPYKSSNGWESSGCDQALFSSAQ